MNLRVDILTTALVVVSILMGGFIGAAIAGGFGPFPPMEWETLIAGLAAVLAAYLTVKTMMFVDERQAQRHAEIIALSVREDALAVDRLHNVLRTHRLKAETQFGVFQRCYDQLREHPADDTFSRKLYDEFESSLNCLRLPSAIDTEQTLARFATADLQLHQSRIERKINEINSDFRDSRSSDDFGYTCQLSGEKLIDAATTALVGFAAYQEDFSAFELQIEELRDRYKAIAKL